MKTGNNEQVLEQCLCPVMKNIVAYFGVISMACYRRIIAFKKQRNEPLLALGYQIRFVNIGGTYWHIYLSKTRITF